MINCRCLPLHPMDTCLCCQSTMTAWPCLAATWATCCQDTRSWAVWTVSSGMEQRRSAKKLSATSQLLLDPHQRCSNVLILLVSLQYSSLQQSHIEGINLMLWLEKSSPLSQSMANQLEPMHSCVILDSH